MTIKQNKRNWKMRETFDVMMDNLMVRSANHPSRVVKEREKIKMIYEITNLGFEGMQVRSLFKPSYKKGGNKC